VRALLDTTNFVDPDLVERYEAANRKAHTAIDRLVKIVERMQRY
jgi:predicted DNA-binding protein (UPF0278 family)